MGAQLKLVILVVTAIDIPPWLRPEAHGLQGDGPIAQRVKAVKPPKPAR